MSDDSPTGDSMSMEEATNDKSNEQIVAKQK